MQMIMLKITAILLYLLFIFLLTCFLINQKLSTKQFIASRKNLVSICLLLSAFLFVPLETLPPMLDTEYGSLVTLMLLLFVNYCQDDNDKKIQNYLGITFLAIIFSLFSLFAYFFGIPGHLFCIETYASPLIWKVLAKIPRVIFILLGVMFATSIVGQIPPKTKKEEGHSLLSTLKTLLYIAIFVAIFIPTYSFTVKGFSFTSRLVAFLLGWAKILAIYFVSWLLHYSITKAKHIN